MLTHQEGTFKGAAGVELYRQSWMPEAGASVALAIVHGFGEHSGRYQNLVGSLVASGYALYAFDHRGHGRSPGKRGHILSWEEYREDLAAFLKTVGAEKTKHPLFVYGHSMGALIVLDYCLRRPQGVKGAIVSGAPIEPAGVANPLMVFMARILSRMFPSLSMSLRLDAQALSRDPEVVKAYEKDPLVHRKASVRWGTESLATIAWVKGQVRDLKVPILLLHGEADRVSLARGSREIFEEMALKDKRLVIYPGCLHEPHNDLDWKKVVQDVRTWMDERS